MSNFADVIAELKVLGVVGPIDLTVSVPEEEPPVVAKEPEPALSLAEEEASPAEEAPVTEEEEEPNDLANLLESAVYALDALGTISGRLKDTFIAIRETLIEEEDDGDSV